MKGFYNRILKIDLSRKTFSIEPGDEKIQADYLGGKGLASYLLYTLNPKGVDPLAPENCLSYATGPVACGSIW